MYFYQQAVAALFRRETVTLWILWSILMSCFCETADQCSGFQRFSFGLKHLQTSCSSCFHSFLRMNLVFTVGVSTFDTRLWWIHNERRDLRGCSCLSKSLNVWIEDFSTNSASFGSIELLRQSVSETIS